MTTEPNSFGNTNRENNVSPGTESIVRSDTMSRAIVEPTGYVAPMGNGRFINDGQRADAVDFQQLLVVIMRRWKLILCTLFLVLASAAAYAMLATKVYQAETTIAIDTSQSRAGNAGSDPTAVVQAMLFPGSRNVDNQVAILKGLPLKKEALKLLNPTERKEAKKLFEYDVSAVGDADMVKIAVRTMHPQLSVRLANIITDQYIESSRKQNIEQVHGARVYVEKQLNKMKGRLNTAQLALATFKKSNGTMDAGAEAKVLVDRLAGIQSGLETARADKNAAVARLKTLQSIAAGLPDSTPKIVGSTPNPQVQAINAQLTQYRIELIQAQQEYSDNHPKVVNLKNQISELQGQLKGLPAFVASSKADVPDAVKADARMEIARLKAEIQGADARVMAAQSAVESGRVELATLPNQEYLLSRLTTDVAAFQQAANLLTEKAMQLQITEAAQPSSARRVFGSESGILVAPKRGRILIIAFVMGLMLALALAAILDRMDSRVHSDADAEMATRLPVLAHVPQIDKPGHERLVGGASDASNFTLLETFQMLRTNISFSMFDEPIRSVLVTSTLPGEGKSTSALNLAVAAAQSGERVILVDCDLRRPSMDRLLKLPNKVGFTSVVAGTATIDEALQETPITGLRVLTTGPTPPNPFRLLNSRAARSLLRELRNHADFVVIDTPPALGMADAQIISTTTDAALLVVSTKGAKKHEIARTRELLSQTGVEMLGTILNRVQTGFGSYYGYGYGYGQGYGYYYGAYAKQGNALEEGTESPNAPAASNGHPSDNTKASDAQLEAGSKEPKRKK